MKIENQKYTQKTKFKKQLGNTKLINYRHAKGCHLFHIADR